MKEKFKVTKTIGRLALQAVVAVIIGAVVVSPFVIFCLAWVME